MKHVISTTSPSEQLHSSLWTSHLHQFLRLLSPPAGPVLSRTVEDTANLQRSSAHCRGRCPLLWVPVSCLMELRWPSLHGQTTCIRKGSLSPTRTRTLAHLSVCGVGGPLDLKKVMVHHFLSLSIQRPGVIEKDWQTCGCRGPTLAASTLICPSRPVWV